jgi:uncharacterized protein with HEPN domain
VSRDEGLYLADMLEACRKVGRFVAGMDQAAFLSDEKTYDAVLRNVQIIGEAAKRIGPDTRSKVPSLDWRKVAGFRDIVVHEYFGIDNVILWDIVSRKVPEIEAFLLNVIDEKQA